MIKNIVFDMGNVLVRYDPEGVLREQNLGEDEIRDIMENFYGRGYINQTDRGVKTHAEVIDEASEHLTERETAVLKHIYVDQVYGINYQKPYEAMYDLVKQLKENGYRIYLLSNAGTDWYIYSKYTPVMSLMDGIVISCEYKVLKPERELYNILLEKYSLNAEECVFIDDLERNIEGAENVGIRGIVHSSKSETVDSLKEKMHMLGIKI